MQTANDSSSLVLRRTMVRFNRSGSGLPEQASWPFTKIVIEPGKLSVKLFGMNLFFTPDAIASLDEYSQAFSFGSYVNEHGIKITPNSIIVAGKNQEPIVRIDVSFRKKDFAKAIDALQSYGFIVGSVPIERF
jgi:hypothetical protein